MLNRHKWRIAVLPGDGIGPEVMRETLRVLDHLSNEFDLVIEREHFPWPSTAWHEEHGELWPADWREQLAQFDSILLGALGDPGPTSDANRYRLSDGLSLSPLLEIRKGFDQWACERPAQRLAGAPQFLADPRAEELDMLVIRENSEGEYVGQGGRLARGTDREIATQTGVFTRYGTERIIRHAFERARQRADERKQGTRATRTFETPQHHSALAQVCLVTKRNALAHWGELYTETFAEVAKEYPDIGTHHELVDAACMKFVMSPWQFDVVVASNLQGDILTDLAAVLSGGMGVAPSCNLNPSDRRKPPMFEPTHGSAPDIAGQDIAGPQAMMLTAAMMLDWMGEEDPSAQAAAARLKDAVAADMQSQGIRNRRCSEVGNAVLERLSN